MNRRISVSLDIFMFFLLAVFPSVNGISKENVTPKLAELAESQKDELYIVALSAIFKGESNWNSEKKGSNQIIFAINNATEFINRKNLSKGQSMLQMEIGGILVGFMDEKQPAEHFKKVGTFPIYEMFPIKQVGDSLQLGFNKYWYSYNPESFPYDSSYIFMGTFAYDNSGTVYFKYDSKQKCYVVEKVESRSI
jgi:hypothetical protein